MTIDRYAAFRQRRLQLIQELGSEAIADAILAEEQRQRIISSEESRRRAADALFEDIRDALRKRETVAASVPVSEPEPKKVLRQDFQEPD